MVKRTHLDEGVALQRGFVPRTAKVCSKCFVSISPFISCGDKKRGAKVLPFCFLLFVKLLKKSRTYEYQFHTSVMG